MVREIDCLSWILCFLLPQKKTALREDAQTVMASLLQCFFNCMCIFMWFWVWFLFLGFFVAEVLSAVCCGRGQWRLWFFLGIQSSLKCRVF